MLEHLGILSRYVGMLIYSRSFLAFTRHEYFCRILCNLIGSGVQNGEAPKDMGPLSEMVADIYFHNANQYFNFNLDTGQ